MRSLFTPRSTARPITARALPVAAVSIAAALTLSACGSSDTSASDNSASAAEPVVTLENCGQEITLTALPERAVTLNQGATESALAVGAQDQLIGTAYLDDDTMVLPGHGERSTIGAERRTNPFLEGLTT